MLLNGCAGLRGEGAASTIGVMRWVLLLTLVAGCAETSSAAAVRDARARTAAERQERDRATAEEQARSKMEAQRQAQMQAQREERQRQIAEMEARCRVIVKDEAQPSDLRASCISLFAALQASADAKAEREAHQREVAERRSDEARRDAVIQSEFAAQRDWEATRTMLDAIQRTAPKPVVHCTPGILKGTLDCR
jgi:hypothetical protein